MNTHHTNRITYGSRPWTVLILLPGVGPCMGYNSIMLFFSSLTIFPQRVFSSFVFEVFSPWVCSQYTLNKTSLDLDVKGLSVGVLNHGTLNTVNLMMLDDYGCCIVMCIELVLRTVRTICLFLFTQQLLHCHVTQYVNC